MISVMDKLLTLTCLRHSLPLWPVHCLRQSKAVAERKDGNAVVSDNSLLEQVAAVV